MKKKLILLYLIIIGVTIIIGKQVEARDFVHLRNINYPLKSDYSITSSGEQITLNVFAGSTKEKLVLKMMNIAPKERIKNFFTLPEGKIPASDLYFVKFSPYNESNFIKQPELVISYDANDKYKEAYFYDWIDLKFKKLESVRDDLNKKLTVELPRRKKIMIALFDEPELVGKASWYVHPKYTGELIAASRDFAIDSKLKVTNLYNNWETIVTVKDYGPKKCSDWTDREQELMGPCQERILDLSRAAFLKLATTTGVGIISNIKVTPIE